jgi:hypothetical protein
MRSISLLSFSLAASGLLLLNTIALAGSLRANRRLSGFSPDNNRYIYLESYQNPVSELPEAKIQIINILSNTCVENGCLETEYGQDYPKISPKAAEDELLKKTVALRQTLGLTRLKVGTRLPLVFRAKQPDGSELVKVIVKQPNQVLQLRLIQESVPSVLRKGNADLDRASMRLEATYNFRKRSLSYLYNHQEGVQKYSIREVRLSPNQRNVVVLIDTTKQTWQGVVQTTSVQTFPL